MYIHIYVYIKSKISGREVGRLGGGGRVNPPDRNIRCGGGAVRCGAAPGLALASKLGKQLGARAASAGQSEKANLIPSSHLHA